MPTLSSSVDHTLYIYFGNAAASNQQNSPGAWSDYKAVWHLSNGTTVSAIDSTGVSDGTLSAVPPTATTGKIDGSASFNGTSNFIFAGNNPRLNFGTGSFTIEFWANANAVQGSGGAYPAIIEKSTGDLTDCGTCSGLGWGVVWLDYASAYTFKLYDGIRTDQVALTGLSNNATWTQIVIAVTKTQYLVYVNGSALTPVARTSTGSIDTASNLNIGRWGLHSREWHGLLDEVRLSTTARSADWIKTEYNNQRSPSSFVSTSALEDYIPSTGNVAPVISSFVASPSVINSGQSSILSWSVVGATSLSINQGIGTITGTSKSVSPTQTTSYTLTATGSGGITTANSTVSVNPNQLPISYYVDSSGGNDSNNGTSSSAPWKTITKVNNSGFQPGDTILFKRGEVWREQLTIPFSGKANVPIVFDAYGTGAAPVISGANIVSGWAKYSGNIYVASVGSITEPDQLYVDGIFYDTAHYPNSGYLQATSDSSDTTSIIDSNLALSANQIVGATVVAKAVPWSLTSLVAIAYNAMAHTITLNGNVYATEKMKTNYGFYLQNMLWMLDAPGEWYYDSPTGKLYLWTASGDNPNNHTIEVSIRPYGIQSLGKNYVTIQNLTITKAKQYDVSVLNAYTVVLNNLTISGGQVGIYVDNITNSTIRNNSVKNALTNGIQTGRGINSNISVSNNTVNNTGNVGTVAKKTGAGLYIEGSNISIDTNTVTNSGYIGINYRGDKTVVENNSIDRSCLVLDDCAGIYTSNANHPSWTSIIRGNTVKNSIGNFSGTPYRHSQADGIYLDDFSHGYVVANNNIYNVEDTGIFIHTGYNNTVTGNSVFGARSHGIRINENSGGATPGTVHDNVVTGNKFETIGTGAAANQYTTVGSTINYGTYNNNQYCHPNSSFAVSNQFINYTLSAWQKFSGQDRNSTDISSYCNRTVLPTSTITTPIVTQPTVIPPVITPTASVPQTIQTPLTPVNEGFGAPGTPPAPTRLAIPITTIQKTILSWSPVSNIVGVVGYSVERCVGVACYTFVPVAAPTNTTYTDENLSASTTYRYRVQAIDAIGRRSPYSAEFQVTTARDSAQVASTLSVPAAAPAANTSAPSSAPTSKVTVTGPLYIGKKGASVCTLQTFLSNYPEFYPDKLVTCFYGPLTTKAVAAFQKHYGIVSSGTPVSTGLGIAGPKTRAKMNALVE